MKKFDFETNQSELFDQIKGIYDKHYNVLTTLNGKDYRVCKCFSECKGKLKVTDNAFFSNYDVKIGKKFGQNTTIPRIVVIGKEGVTPQNQIEETGHHSNQHYRRTMAMLSMLLSLTNQIVDDTVVSKENFMYDDIPIYDLFCLTNHYHCAFKQGGKRHGVSCTIPMWNNCAYIVKDELNILKPQILVIQSGWSVKKGRSKGNCKDIQKYFDKDIGVVKTNQEIDGTEIDGLYWLVDESNHKICCIIGSYHPCYHQWRKDKYLSPLENRIRIAREWFKTQI